MNSNQVKAEIKRRFNVVAAVRTIPSVKPDRWVEARIRPNAGSLHTNALTFPASFSELFRRAGLGVVYGAGFAQKQQAGGNIGFHSISLFESQWTRVFEALDAVKTCSDGSPDCDLACLLSYLSARTALETRELDKPELSAARDSVARDAVDSVLEERREGGRGLLGAD